MDLECVFLFVGTNWVQQEMDVETIQFIHFISSKWISKSNNHKLLYYSLEVEWSREAGKNHNHKTHSTKVLITPFHLFPFVGQKSNSPIPPTKKTPPLRGHTASASFFGAHGDALPQRKPSHVTWKSQPKPWKFHSNPSVLKTRGKLQQTACACENRRSLHYMSYIYNIWSLVRVGMLKIHFRIWTRVHAKTIHMFIKALQFLMGYWLRWLTLPPRLLTSWEVGASSSSAGFQMSESPGPLRTMNGKNHYKSLAAKNLWRV